MGIIAGIYTNKSEAALREISTSMLHCQRHRDDSDPIIVVNDHVAIGMANKHDTIFCNREFKYVHSTGYSPQNGIYGFVDGIVLESISLQKALQSQGVFVKSPACSSIISAAYERWSLDFMSHLEGEFSCALWMPNEKKIILARDPYGHKPLHYYWDGKSFIFSSEIKGILAAGVEREIDLVNFSDFLTLNCIPYPGTIFKNIFQVPPGNIIIFHDGRITKKEYCQIKLCEDASISVDEAALQLEQAIRNAVRKRMVTDKTYCFLSGGIDSSAIISFASEIWNSPVHAISVGFEEEEENELEDAAIMAKHVGAEHHKIIARPESFFDMLETLVFHHDAPFTDTSAYPTYFAGKLAGELTNVILTGDGPDQTMGGSEHHTFAIRHDSFAPRREMYQVLSKWGSNVLQRLVKSPTPNLLSKAYRRLYRESISPVHAVFDLRSYFPDIVKKFMCSEEMWHIHMSNSPYRHPESWFNEAGDVDDINKYLYADMKFYLPDDLMIKVDRMCMAHGLETLSPFQDVRIASIVNTLPSSYKIHMKDGEVITKYILKKVCKKRFPPYTLQKKKQGFGIPLEKWLRQNNGKMIREIMLDPLTLNRPYFKRQSLEHLVNIFLSGSGDYFYPASNGIVALLTFELWHRKYLD